MNKSANPDNVGAPDPELITSPIMEEMNEDFEILAQGLEKNTCCYFNSVMYNIGDYVCSGSTELLRCENGIWVQEGTCDTDNP